MILGAATAVAMLRLPVDPDNCSYLSHPLGIFLYEDPDCSDDDDEEGCGGDKILWRCFGFATANTITFLGPDDAQLNAVLSLTSTMMVSSLPRCFTTKIYGS